MNNESLTSFIFKSVFAAFIGFILATSLDTGKFIYQSYITRQECSVKFIKKLSTGYLYSWTITKKDRNYGSIFIYPKSDTGLLLKSVEVNEENKNVVIAPENIGMSYDGKVARGLLFKYLPNKNNIIINFDTISNQIITNSNESESCEQLLLNF